jgi:RNA polymerase sigma-70 factor, ECF subfamily
MTDDEIREEYKILENAKRDSRAFGALYEKYFDQLFRFAHHRTDDADLAADLCSQTFLIVLNHLEKYEFRGVPFSAWLYKIAGNEIKKHFRSQKGHMLFSIEQESIKALIDQENVGYTEDQVQQLIDFLKDLPTDMVEVLHLRFFEDRDFKEIAFILDITESGVKMRTYRALDLLRKKFKLRIKYDGKK